jgi:predicted porin
MSYCQKQPLLSSRTIKQTLLAAMIASAATAGAAQAADDGSLTWNGVTLYGTVDIGVAYQTHGTPLSDDFYTGLGYLISKNSNKSITSIAPNAMSQSKVGLKGTEQIADGLSVVFKVETGFNPQSGKISDALQSLVNNNGRALASQTTNADGGRAGQIFNGAAYAGLTSKDFGTVTLGRQTGLLTDAIGKYDPQGGSYAFSVIGYSGATAGGGDTENTRLDRSIKYLYSTGPVRVSGLYQFGNTGGSGSSATQFDIGGDYAGFSLDGLYSKKKGAIGASPLSAAQFAILPHDSLAATVSDNTTFTLAANYTTGPFKISGGYEHITYKNPSDPLVAGFNGLGGYEFSVVNNNAYAIHKVLEVSWIGAKYKISDALDLTGAYYHYDQNSYKGNGCSDASAGSCSGSLNAFSLVADYKFSKRFDVYAGAMFSKVSDGLASGYLHTSTVDPTIGGRFNF